ncbi:NADP-dependent oxidoreductase [Cryobacterium sp. SO2]|uniref:NADP-dependent oxidoreductase n=1 Tax=Cryobacterium sp. SO2 TaxID=1897060 RepID=UPI00223E6702|nr:NADP-dependent oxidoreductase [Cryobacterium sp. SO2]WEO79014.1 NADP-dependent oxidoreductase [Cryobacterium sp. SO2]
MIAVQFDQHGPSSVLHLVERAMPAVPAGCVLVHVRAAGVSPVDIALRAGGTPLAASLSLPHITGIDAAGVVVEIGTGVTDVVVGDEVFGTVVLTEFGGAAAEYAVLAQWGPKPSAWSWAEAGAAGSAVETATRALDLLDVSPGSVVLVDGAAGGVGSIAAQLAVALGARVFGTAREGSLHIVESLPGVTAVRTGLSWRDVFRHAGIDRADAAVDTSGAGVLPALIAATGSADRVVTIADLSAADYGVRLTRGALAGEATGRHGLRAVAGLGHGTVLTVPLRGTFPFAQAAAAHDAAAERPRWGKVALVNDQPC